MKHCNKSYLILLLNERCFLRIYSLYVHYNYLLDYELPEKDKKFILFPIFQQSEIK